MMEEEITIEKAEKFFLNRDTRAAGNMAGILLEQSVQKLCAFHQVPLSSSPSTRGLLDLLRDAYAIPKEKHRELQNLVSIRNKCAHATPITREEVRTLIRGTKEFIRLVGSQSSTASAKPFASQHPQDIHAADPLYLFHLYAQPLTKIAQTAKPADPSLLCSCSNCGHHNKLQLYKELQRRFCSRCGSPLNQCEACRNHNPITSRSCMRCGELLTLLCSCSSCGHHNKLQLYKELQRRFCSRCGSPLNQCEACGNHNPITSRFCIRCGHS